MKLHFVTNNAYDSLILEKNGVLVSQWTINGEEADFGYFLFERPEELKYWGIHDEDGIDPQDMSEWGEVVATLDSEEGLIIKDENLWRQRLDYYGIDE